MDLIYMQMKAIKRENTRWKSKKEKSDRERKRGEGGGKRKTLGAF